MVWGRIKHAIILDDPFDDPAGLADLIPDKSPELKPPAEVMTCHFLLISRFRTWCAPLKEMSCASTLLCSFGVPRQLRIFLKFVG